MTTTARQAFKGAASERLVRALINAAAAGLRTHCSDGASKHMWLSDDEQERAVAVELCSGCPVIRECGEAASARGEKFGVWAAEDKTPPKPVATGKAAR
jgi:hypothetical protein